MAITKFNRFIALQKESGKVVMNEMLLQCSVCRFNEIDWETGGETIQIKSTEYPFKKNGPTTQACFGNDPEKTNRMFALFSVRPFKFEALFGITEATFGSISQVEIGDGLVIICQNKTVRLYSLASILNDAENQVPVSHDFLLNGRNLSKSLEPRLLKRLTHIIKQAPPVLYEIRAPNHSVRFGGHIFHTIARSPRNSKLYQVRELQTGNLAINGEFSIQVEDLESLQFHSDDTERVLHVSREAVKVFKISLVEASSSTTERRTRLNLQFELKPSDSPSAGQNSPVEVFTSSGRKVRRRIVETCSDKILAYDFEDELEFWSILGTKTDWDSGPNLRFCMFDNETGERLKDIDLGITMNEVSFKKDVTPCLGLSFFFCFIGGPYLILDGFGNAHNYHPTWI